MSVDNHVAANGFYNVRSLYFDDVFHSAYYANENGVEPRDKFRIRMYNYDTTNIFLEKKQKRHGMTIKDSCALTIAQAECLISGQDLVFGSETPQLLLEFVSRSKFQRLFPVVIVDYD